jgi:hypothetical protein
MTEDFLHYVWRYKRLSWMGLKTTQGQSVDLLLVGEHNHHAGPDFTNARIRIDDTTWAGNVEIHIKASDWKKHGHQHDPAYNNVILHVVLDEDVPAFRANGERMPCLELRHYILPNLQQMYLRLISGSEWVPCQSHWPEVPQLTQTLWLERLLIERLEHKTADLQERFVANAGDWEETFFQLLSKTFGLTTNTQPFEQLSRSISFKLLHQHRHSLLHLEALLFGQAGFLEEDFVETYPRQLQQAYRFFQQKYQLVPIEKSNWKFLRMRPANFPTIRIAQLATLLYQSEHLLEKVLAARHIAELNHLFGYTPQPYWSTHYLLDKPASRKIKRIGHNRIHLLVVNAVAPLLFFYGQQHGDPSYQDRALDLLEALPAEDNNIINAWKKMGLQPKTSGSSQALIHLKQNYCNPRRCLHCAIGHTLFQKTTTENFNLNLVAPIENELPHSADSF